MAGSNRTAKLPQPEDRTVRRDFRRYLIGSSTSTFGYIFTGVATAVLAVDAFHVTGIEWWAAAALSLLVVPAAAGSLPVVVLLVSLGLAGTTLCGAAANVTLVALFSDAIPERAMGRVNATLMVLTTLATMIGALAAGTLADLVSVRGAVWTCAITGVAALPILRPLWRPTDPQHRVSTV